MGLRGIGARRGRPPSSRGRKRTGFFALAAGSGSRGVAGFGARAGRTTHLPVLVIGPVFFRRPGPGNLRGRLVPGRHPARPNVSSTTRNSPQRMFFPFLHAARASLSGGRASRARPRRTVRAVATGTNEVCSTARAPSPTRVEECDAAERRPGPRPETVRRAAPGTCSTTGQPPVSPGAGPRISGRSWENLPVCYPGAKKRKSASSAPFARDGRG